MKFLLSILTLAGAIHGKIIYAGVNESGGEFGSQNLPGAFGIDYAFINKYFDEYADAINYITVEKGAYALLDPHNYMRYNDPSAQPFSGSVIGNTSDPTAATTEQFGEFWTELAGRFVDNPKVIFGINNEPHDMLTSLVLANNQAAIDGIRSTGAEQLILAPGNSWTGGHSWTEGSDPSSALIHQFVDPLNNTGIDIHETSISLEVTMNVLNLVCTLIDAPPPNTISSFAIVGPENLAAVTAWLQEHNLKAVLSEFGGANNDNCRQMVDELLSYLDANDVWIGWTAWAAGPFWGPFSPCCGADTGSLEPGVLNSLGEPNAFETVWTPSMKPHVIPEDLKKNGTSSLEA
ncbi:hypothetical protein PM082_007083 [Marasmius tenuissimus]|nr:hypothetical protein PM082_007083 [Marasmius tenuissimus]